MNLNQIWSVLEECFEPLSEHGFPVWAKTAAELGLEPGWMTWVAAIWIFSSEPFSTKAFMRVLSYGSASVNEARFASAVNQGVLVVTSEKEYRTTEKGKRLADQILQAGDASIAHLQPMPSAEFQKLLGFHKRLVEASLAAPEPPAKFGVTHYYRNMHPG